MTGQRCPDCHHASHAGRCHFVATPKGHYIQCACKHKRGAPDVPCSRCGRQEGEHGSAEFLYETSCFGYTTEEAPHDTDRRDDRHDPSVGTPTVRPADGIRAGLGSVEHEARLQLARKGVKLSGFAEELLHEIGEIGQTMTDGAARMRGESS